MGNFFFCDGRNVCFLFPFFFGWIYFRPNNVPHDVNDHLSLSRLFTGCVCPVHISHFIFLGFFCFVFFALFFSTIWLNEWKIFLFRLFISTQKRMQLHTYTHTRHRFNSIQLWPNEIFHYYEFCFFWGENQTKKISPFSVKVSHCIIYIHQFICVFRCSN